MFAVFTMAGMAAFLTCSTPPGTTPERLEVRPIDPPRPGAYGLLGFEIRAPWLNGFLQMRMPETLNSSLGLHFIDHNRADMRPLSQLKTWPKWSRDRRSGALSYSVRLPEGVEFSGKAVPLTDRVQMEFRVRNRTKSRIENITNQMCLVLTHSRDFGETNTLARMWAFRDGRPFDLAQTTPTPAGKGRDPWVLMLTQSGSRSYTGPRDYPDGWWVVDQTADLPVIARKSDDGQRLVAISWDGDPMYLMSNTRIPCLHAGPTNALSLEPGKECVWRGAVWLMENDAEKLRREFQKSFPGGR